MPHEFDYVVVGAGIIGLATAHRLQQKFPHARIAVVEKEQGVAQHQSSHSSGVIHAGIYYPPDSLKARFCRLGVAATLAFCAAHDVRAEQCGKLIVATNAAEATRLQALAVRAANNGLACSWLDEAGIYQREPAIVGHAALFVAQTGIADYGALCHKLAQLIAAAGGEVIVGARVSAIDERAAGVVVETPLRTLKTARLIVCGGLQADRLARLAGLDIDLAIVPFRGDYYRLPTTRNSLVKTLIYPVPDPRLPFLGVHLTLTTDGRLTLGPTAMLAFARERYRKWAFDGRDFFAAVTHPGTWRLLARFPRAGALEIAHAASRRLYLAEARRYCPQLTLDDLDDPACGVRAQAVSRKGEMISDFLIERTARSVHVLNAPSPAATAAFPIAQSIIEHLDRGAN